ncbi:aspartate--tRNA ligase [Candidatus Peribacteria bacterium]|nr:aspartate--tRNA ligase [Candidatus Peribacteria bacterium]
MIFIDIRDRYGITQLVFDPQTHAEASHIIESARAEWVIKIEGEVRARPSGQENNDLTTGAIEVLVSTCSILSKSKTPPFEISDHSASNEDIRYKYRYLDLRRDIQRKKIEFRAKVNAYAREWFQKNGFLEIQTPLFTVSSPEGARDYVIPSRLHPGKFYALPQAPQQYKQLLMVGGIDKYFQIAPCFRDEDPRADRHSCEFYQIDCEMSFVHQEDVLEVAENFARELVQTVTPERKLITPVFTRITHHEAIEKYGSDKPDLRFDCHFEDFSHEFASSGFSVFSGAIEKGGVVKAFKLPGVAMSRKDIDEVTALAVEQGAKGLAYIIYEETGPKSPILKFMNQEELNVLETKLAPKV